MLLQAQRAVEIAKKREFDIFAPRAARNFRNSISKAIKESTDAKSKKFKPQYVLGAYFRHIIADKGWGLLWSDAAYGRASELYLPKPLSPDDLAFLAKISKSCPFLACKPSADGRRISFSLSMTKATRNTILQESDPNAAPRHRFSTKEQYGSALKKHFFFNPVAEQNARVFPPADGNWPNSLPKFFTPPFFSFVPVKAANAGASQSPHLVTSDADPISFDLMMAMPEINKGIDYFGISKAWAAGRLKAHWPQIKTYVKNIIDARDGKISDLPKGFNKVFPNVSVYDALQEVALVFLYSDYLSRVTSKKPAKGINTSGPNKEIASNIIDLECSYIYDAVNPTGGDKGAFQTTKYSAVSFDKRYSGILEKQYGKADLEKWSKFTGHDGKRHPFIIFSRNGKQRDWASPEAEEEILKMHVNVFYGLLHIKAIQLSRGSPSLFQLGHDYNGSDKADLYAKNLESLVNSHWISKSR